MHLWRKKNGKRYRNFIFFFGNLKIEKRPENEREKRPAHEGPALGVRIHIRNVCKRPQKTIFGAILGPKPHFYGSQKPKNLKIEFNYLGLALY